MIIPRTKSIVALSVIALLAISTVPTFAATKATTPKPAASSAPKRGGFSGGPNAAAFAKYQACLTKAGVKLPSFGGGGGRGFGSGTPGTRPSGIPTTRPATPRPRPTFSLSPAQQKAMASCASLRPTFSGFGAGGKSASGKSATKPTSAPKGVAPKTGTSAAYIACLNTHGLPVQTAAQIAGLDKENTKVIAAEKACAGK
ncbi:MAG: hypothetical protein WDN07_02280 [Actinomycetota bacterium]